MFVCLSGVRGRAGWMCRGLGVWREGELGCKEFLEKG